MDPSTKKQVIDRLGEAKNILVTVTSDPSIDQLSACIGLALFLNNIEKRGTAVFSGRVPSAIEFLKPEKTLERTTDSLRDFIVSLDKSKADKLRYKVEDEVVKIFITPYKVSLGQKDLDFSQGDFNIDVVMALGVHKREDLDKAITAHGRILHDATVISVNNKQQGDLGSINWVDEGASSLCEMMADLAANMGKEQVDNQIATAFLTGIVAETERFSNEKTSPQTMTQASYLMAAGANQQLISSQLDESRPDSNVVHAVEKDIEPDTKGTLSIEHLESEEPDSDELPKPVEDVIDKVEPPESSKAEEAEEGSKIESNRERMTQPPSTATLEEIEESIPGVHENKLAYELGATEGLAGKPDGSQPEETIDDAREAVDEAIRAAGPGDSLEPIVALNAQPVDLDLNSLGPVTPEPQFGALPDNLPSTMPPAMDAPQFAPAPPMPPASEPIMSMPQPTVAPQADGFMPTPADNTAPDSLAFPQSMASFPSQNIPPAPAPMMDALPMHQAVPAFGMPDMNQPVGDMSAPPPVPPPMMPPMPQSTPMPAFGPQQ